MMNEKEPLKSKRVEQMSERGSYVQDAIRDRGRAIEVPTVFEKHVPRFFVNEREIRSIYYYNHPWKGSAYRNLKTVR